MLGVVDERVLALLERDRVHHRLALHAFEAGLDHREFRGIDHHRHARDVGLGRDQIEERRHRLLGIEQALVHVDVDDLRAVLDLIARDGERGGVVAGGDELAKARRAGDVGALADIDERDFRRQRERFEAGQPQPRRHARESAAASCPRRRAAMARMWSGVVPQQPPTMLTRPAAANSPISAAMYSRAFVVVAELVRQAGIGIGADQRVGDARRARRCARASAWRRARN